jgi:hypothetical protein
VSGRSYSEQSRHDWSRKDNVEGYTAEIQAGCLQRIAAATELMAKPFAELIAEKQRADAYRLRTTESLLRKNRTIAALRGVITRLKRDHK